MFRLLLLLAVVTLASGCATFRVGDVSETQIINSTSGSPLDKVGELPIVLYYHTNYGSYSGKEEEKTKSLIIEAIKASVDSEKVAFLEEYETIPNEYIQIVVVRDFQRDFRQESNPPSFIRMVNAIISGFTLMIVPGIDYDFENYLKISHIKDEEIQNSSIYQQMSRRYYGLFLLPASANNTIDSALAETIEDVVKGKENR